MASRYLLIPMDSPGITVRPLRDISGAAHFAEVFLDDVEVAVDNRVGDEGEGWSIMRTSLGHERATAFLADEFKYRHTVDKVINLTMSQRLDADPLVRQEIARLESECGRSPRTARGRCRRSCGGGPGRRRVGEPAGEVRVRTASALVGAARGRAVRSAGQQRR